MNTSVNLAWSNLIWTRTRYNGVE